MSKNKNTTQKQEVVSKKPVIPIPTKLKFDFKKPLFNNRGPSFMTAFKTQNRGGK